MNGYTLKLIALITMVIDHLLKSDIISQPLLIQLFGLDLSASSAMLQAIGWIGRIAYPIYAFLIAEGYRHTRNKGRYLLRLLAFAVISEIPYDIALTPMYIDWYKLIPPFKHMNVLFTFTLSVGGLMLYDIVDKRRLLPVLRWGTLALPVFIAFACGTDYAGFGVLIVYTAYFIRGKNTKCFAMAAALFLLYGVYSSGFFMNLSTANLYEWVASCGAVILIRLYNGKRGRGNKWFFYAAYPVHLGVIALLNMLVV